MDFSPKSKQILCNSGAPAMMPLLSAIAHFPHHARALRRTANDFMDSLPSAGVLARAVGAGMIAVALAASPAAASGTASRHQKAAAPDLEPDGTVPDRIVKSGEQTGVASVWDCGLPNFAPVV